MIDSVFQTYTSNIKLLPIAHLCYDFLLKMFGPELEGEGVLELLGYDTFLWLGEGLKRSRVEQDVVFTALLFLRRLLHFHGSSLGPLGDTHIRAIFLAALSVAYSVLDDHDAVAAWWVDVFDFSDQEIIDPEKRRADAVAQLLSARNLFCKAMFYDLIPHSKQFFDPFKASLIAHFEGRVAGGNIKGVTNRCVLNASEKPDFANYQCMCGRIEAPLSSYYPTVMYEARAEELKVMFPREGGAASALGICGTRVSDSGIEEVPRFES